MGSKVAPFAGNNILVLFLCPGNDSNENVLVGVHINKYYVQVLHNEIPVPMPVYTFVSIKLGDSLYKICFAIYKLFQLRKKREVIANNTVTEEDRLFERDHIPLPLVVVGHLTVIVLSVILIPSFFLILKWYHMLVFCLSSPLVAIPNVFLYGFTDCSITVTSGPIVVFIFGVWVSFLLGGAFIGLTSCAILLWIVLNVTQFLEDYMIGYISRTSPRSMIISHAVGIVLGCCISPLVYYLMNIAFPLNTLISKHTTSYGGLFKGMQALAVNGLVGLPKYCIQLCTFFFFLAIVVNIFRQILKPQWSKYIPDPMYLSVSFYNGASFVIDMSVGSIILLVWGSWKKVEMEVLAPPVAWGLIFGEMIWKFPAAVLSLAKIKAPFCLRG